MELYIKSIMSPPSPQPTSGHAGVIPAGMRCASLLNVSFTARVFPSYAFRKTSIPSSHFANKSTQDPSVATYTLENNSRIGVQGFWSVSRSCTSSVCKVYLSNTSSFLSNLHTIYPERAERASMSWVLHILSTGMYTWFGRHAYAHCKTDTKVFCWS